MAQAGRHSCGAEFLRLSVGAAFYPEDGQDAEELLATADARMYEMKRDHHSQADRLSSLLQLAAAVEPDPKSVTLECVNRTA